MTLDLFTRAEKGDELTASDHDANFAAIEAAVNTNISDITAKQPLDATLTALAALSATAGLIEQTGTDTFAKRALGVAAGTSIPTRSDADTRYAAASHTHTASQISDATVAGQALLTATDAAAQRTLLNVATGADNTATAIHAASNKATPVDADEIGLLDSAASFVLRRVTWANIKTVLKAFFDPLYAAISHTHTESDVTNLVTDLAAKAPLASPTFTGNPTVPTAAPGDSSTLIANTAFVENRVQTAQSGLDYKDSVRAGTTANITLSGTQTVDTVALTAGQRILVKNQTTTSANGIYVVAAGSWSRSTDADSWNELVGAYVVIEEGSQADTAWICTANQGGTLGSTSVTWTTSGSGGASATGTSFVPAGAIAANNVQTAIEELDAEKAPLVHTHAQSDVTNLVTDLAAKAPTARTLTAGNGLSGGGDLSANRTFDLDLQELVTDTTGGASGDFLVFCDASESNASNKVAVSDFIANANLVQSAFKTIAVAGQSDVAADAVADILTLIGGTNVSITTDAGTDSITINASGASGYGTVQEDGTPIAQRTIINFGTGLTASDNAGSSRTDVVLGTHTHAESDVTNLVTDLAAKAPLASPALTGTPTSTTAAADTNTTQIATCAYVQGELTDRALTTRSLTAGVGISGGGDLSSDRTFTLDLNELTTDATGGATGDFIPFVDVSGSNSSDKVLVSDFITNSGIAVLASPALSGSPTAPTAAVDTNSTQIATTAYVQGELTDRALTTRNLTAGNGLSGGGTLAADRTFDLDLNELTVDATGGAPTDYLPFVDVSGSNSSDKVLVSDFITNAGITTTAFKTIAVSGQSNIDAETPADTLTLVAGSNITITTVPGTDSITIGVTSVGTGIVDEINRHIGTVANQTYWLSKAVFGYTIDSLWRQVKGSGTCTVAIQINGTNVGALSALTANTTGAEVTATTAKTVVAGDEVSLVITGNSACLDLFIRLKIIRT